MSTVQRISPADAQRLMNEEGYVYVDVRSEPEYAAGHPAGASNVPLLHLGGGGRTPNPDFVTTIAALYDKDAKIILGCQTGNRSMHAAQMLIAEGFTHVVEQRAGFKGARNAFGVVVEPGWEASGLPVETVTPGASYAELKNKAGRSDR